MAPILISRLLQNLAVRTFLISLMLWLTAFGLLKEHLWRAPRSGFFEDATVYDLGYKEGSQKDELATEDAPICAALVTYNRPGRQYLNETIGSMIGGLVEDEREALNVRLLFAQTDITVHPDWGAPWLQVLDSWSGYNASVKDLELVSKAERERNFYFKGVFDYIYALDECISQSPAPFIAIFEDDIIFAEGWLPKTVAALHELKGYSQNWLYLRLFYTETSLGWETEEDFWYRHMSATFLFTMSAVLVLLLFISLELSTDSSELPDHCGLGAHNSTRLRAVDLRTRNEIT